MGTPEIALDTLSAINEKHEVVGVISQPDKPSGRGNKLTPTPVKALAQELGLDVYQPERIKSKESFELIQRLNPDIIVVIAYGQILPARVLDYPKHGTINIHGSLLPQYRGASPIQQAILNGDKITGITIMQMDVGMDTGDMILKSEIEIPTGYTSGDLFKTMGELAPEPLLEALEQIEKGTVVRTPQGDDFTHAPMISKEMGNIDWNKPSDQIVNLIHGLNPWPGAYTYIGGDVLKVWKAREVSDIITTGDTVAGQVIKASPKEGIIIKTANTLVRLTEVQKKGSKKLPDTEFIKGNPIKEGEICSMM